MKNFSATLCVAAKTCAASFALVALVGCQTAQPDRPEDVSANTANAAVVVPQPVLRHVVFFGFNENLTPAQVKEVEDAFAALPAQIKEVKAFEWGTDCSPERLQKGHTHAFVLKFATAKDRDAYLVHPAHKAFGKLISGKIKTVTVLDYWVK
ncbi:MAG: Dabb family protein [Puniceicoccales bacterium]|jgi:hypothetical protein|nr:Dabb family protein [Puniceicoccales bacterium]